LAEKSDTVIARASVFAVGIGFLILALVTMHSYGWYSPGVLLLAAVFFSMGCVCMFMAWNGIGFSSVRSREEQGSAEAAPETGGS